MKFAQNGEQPLVSVCIITYNHEKNISEAINSVITQETDFPCEVIIADDCSTDKTREIIVRYAEKYPLRLILQEKNKGAARNWKDLMDAPLGKYVAYFEGDDFWIDSQKLKKQVSFLEENEEMVACYANAKVFDSRNPDAHAWFPGGKPPIIMDCYSTVLAFTMPTCTILFRNLLRPLPEWILKAQSGDHLLVAMLSKFGKVYYMDEYFGKYNHDYTGVSRARGEDRFLIGDFHAWLHLDEYYDHDPKMWEAIVQKCIGNLDMLFYRGFPNKARRLFWQWPLFKVWRAKTKRSQIIKLFVKLYFPFFLSFRKAYQKHKARKLATA